MSSIARPDLRTDRTLTEATNRRTWLALNAFSAILQRDITVTGREFLPFLLQALMQPLFFLFIFRKVLPGIGLRPGTSLR